MSLFRKKLLIHVGIFLAMMIVFGVSIFFIGKRVSSQATEIEGVRKQLYDWIVSLESFASIRAEYTMKAERYTRVLENRLPEKQLLIDLKKDVQFLAGSEGLSSNLVFNQDVSTQSGQMGAISLTMTLSGDYDAVTRFIGRLNELRYLMSIESMTVTRRDAKSVDVEAKGRVLYMK